MIKFIYLFLQVCNNSVNFQELPIPVFINSKIIVMKKIEAIVRKSRFEEVREALHEADIDFLSWWEVKGQGTARQGLIFRGIAYDVNSVARMYISFVVRDINFEKSINAILKAAYTGESGDGRIFVTQIEQSIRIRTGDKGDESLYDKDSK
jgi:nitrogen regulatory protein P-II 1